MGPAWHNVPAHGGHQSFASSAENMDFNIQTSDIDPTVDRLRRRQASTRRTQRMAVAASFAAGLTWLVGGLLIFGVEWIQQLSEYLLAGVVFGTFIGGMVVCYTIWIEFKALVTGSRAVWTNDAAHAPRPTMGSYLRHKVAFAALTLLASGVFGALVASLIALKNDLNTNIGGAAALMVLTACIASAAAVWTRRSIQPDPGSNDSRTESDGITSK